MAANIPIDEKEDVSALMFTYPFMADIIFQRSLRRRITGHE